MAVLVPSVPNNISMDEQKASYDAGEKPAPVENKEKLSYSDTKSSSAYLKGKQFLTDGKFEDGLIEIEKEINRIKDLLPEESKDLHPSLAPLHYLYGTTLLYSVEESTDPSSGMVVGSPEEEEGSDIEIAWENLDTARAILSNLDEKEDTAQVYQRLGDLQRANGNYAASVQDYEICLETRMELFGLFHRKVADAHYNLGVTYLLLASESEDESAQHKINSMLHYYESLRAFAGIIAQSCGIDPHSVVSKKAQGAQKKVASFLTGNVATLPEDIKLIRSKLPKLYPPEKQELIDDLKEIIDEIQETIENSDESLAVLQDVHKNKQEQARKLLGKEHEGQVAEQKPLSQSAAHGTTTVGFSTSMKEETPPQVVNTLMPVRKKKKRENPLQDSSLKKPKPSSE